MNLVWNMKLFVRIVELNSFRLAAHEIGMSAAAATRSMAQLEEHLGAKLLLRTTRSIQLTTCGGRYLEGCRAWLGQLNELEMTIQQADPSARGKLRIVSTMEQSSQLVRDILDGFRSTYPRIVLEYSLLEHRADIDHNHFDIAILPGIAKARAGYTAHTLTNTPLICVASPQYLRRKGLPETPEDLLNHTYVSPSSVPDGAWHFQSVSRNFEIGILKTAFITDTLSDALDAVFDGIGFMMGSPDELRQGLGTGQLHHVLPAYFASNAQTAIGLIVPQTKVAWTSVSKFVGLACEVAQKAQRSAWANVNESSYG